LNNSELEATGEFLVPGKFPHKTEKEHIERYVFASKIARNKTVLDIACGVGYGCKILSDAGALSVEGVDLSEKIIDYAKQNYQDDKIKFNCYSIYDLTKKGEYDLITCFETIEHVQDDRAALRKLHDALKEDGYLIISTPNRRITSPKAKKITDKPSNQFHTREYLLHEFIQVLEECKFKVIDVYGQRNRIVFPFLILNRILNKVIRLDHITNAKPKKFRLAEARYFTIVLKKKS
jgi:ubiquinone biosynthesis O-methyltransferase